MGLAGKGRKAGGQQNRGAGNNSKLCYTHQRFGDRAYVCKGGECPKRNKPLAERPEKNAKSKSETAAAETDNCDE